MWEKKEEIQTGFKLNKCILKMLSHRITLQIELKHFYFIWQSVFSLLRSLIDVLNCIKGIQFVSCRCCNIIVPLDRIFSQCNSFQVLFILIPLFSIFSPSEMCPLFLFMQIITWKRSNQSSHSEFGKSLNTIEALIKRWDNFRKMRLQTIQWVLMKWYVFHQIM